MPLFLLKITLSGHFLHSLSTFSRYISENVGICIAIRSNQAAVLTTVRPPHQKKSSDVRVERGPLVARFLAGCSRVESDLRRDLGEHGSWVARRAQKIGALTEPACVLPRLPFALLLWDSVLRRGPDGRCSGVVRPRPTIGLVQATGHQGGSGQSAFCIRNDEFCIGNAEF